jgi:hypothetical protein
MRMCYFLTSDMSQNAHCWPVVQQQQVQEMIAELQATVSTLCACVTF